MKTRSITLTTTFVATVPADMSDDEIQDIGLQLDVSKITIRTFAGPIKGAQVVSYTTESVQPNES